MFFICLSKFSLLSKFIPKYLYELTIEMYSLSMMISSGHSFFLIVAYITIAAVKVTLIVSLLH